jgi:chromosome segregation protein
LNKNSSDLLNTIKERKKTLYYEQELIQKQRIEFIKKESEILTLEKEVSNLDKEREKTRQYIETLKKESMFLEKRLKELKLKIDSLKEKEKELVETWTKRQELLKKSSAEIERRKTELIEIEIKRKKLAKEREKTFLAKKDLEIRNQEAKNKLQEIEQLVMERYGLELKNVIGRYHLFPPAEESLDLELKRIRQEIDSLGHVNLQAIEDFEKERVRLTRLKEQRSDLEEALNSLKRAIWRLDIESKQRFKKAFYEIDAHFQTLFPLLFKGGRARLVIEDEGNPLESKVDIIAEPPGKKIKDINLLSGGEKALIAIAFIFAIFKANPSPFCILDEVDAPLDDCNIDRFSELVREICSTSQVILITHNKRTMEIADLLYGVTMEEAGISKVISCELKELKD